MLAVHDLRLPDVKMIVAEKHEDARGYFSETYNKKAFAEAGIDLAFVQDNHVFSASQHVLRGLHYQTPPYAQSKLVRVTRGAIFDVAVDLRQSSPTFGQWVAVELSARDCSQLLIPAGFAHGYLTLEPSTEVFYKVTAFYAPRHDFGILWSDPTLAIEWPVPREEIAISDKDRNQPLLKNALYLFN